MLCPLLLIAHTCLVDHWRPGLVDLAASRRLILQALVKILDDVSNEDIRSLEIPTGVPLVYELDDALKPVRHFHVGCASICIQ